MLRPPLFTPVPNPPPHPLDGLGDALPPRNDDRSPSFPSRKPQKFCPEPQANPWANAWANPQQNPPMCGQTPGQTPGQTLGKPLHFLGKPLFDRFFECRKHSMGLPCGSDQPTLLSATGPRARSACHDPQSLLSYVFCLFF